MTIPRPLLAHLYAPKRFLTPCYIQPKLDGIRALYVNGQFYSRDLVQWRPEVVQHLTSQLTSVPPDVVLDGEFYVHGWPVQRINGAIAVKRLAPTKLTLEVGYSVFDLVDHNLPFEERWSQAWDHLMTAKSYQVPLVEIQRVTHPDDVEMWFSYYTQRGYEGCMVRPGNNPYTIPGHGSDQDNRTWTLLKRKGWLDGTYPIVGVQPGEGKHLGRMGALQLRTPEGRVFEVGTGFSDAERERMDDSVIGETAKIKYRSLTQDLKPFHPTFIEIV